MTGWADLGSMRFVDWRGRFTIAPRLNSALLPVTSAALLSAGNSLKRCEARRTRMPGCHRLPALYSETHLAS